MRARLIRQSSVKGCENADIQTFHGISPALLRMAWSMSANEAVFLGFTGQYAFEFADIPSRWTNDDFAIIHNDKVNAVALLYIQILTNGFRYDELPFGGQFSFSHLSISFTISGPQRRPTL